MMPTSSPLPTHYMVGPIRVEPNVVLAPMEGVTDVSFRRLIRQIGGVGLTVTEFIASEGLKRGVSRMHDMARFDPDERPVAIQIYGRSPEVMAEAGRIVEDLGASIVDINMGCPSKKVCAHSGGSALMTDLDLAREIIASVKAAISIPLTVKMRSGFDHDKRNAADLAHICQEEGVAAIAIHWRTRTDKYGGERRVDQIAAAVDRVSIPVLANGDIIDIPSAVRMFQETGCAGVMVGRGAMRNPWLLKQITEHLRGEPITQVTAKERLEVLMSYLAAQQGQFSTERAALGRFKQIVNHFTRSLAHGSTARMRMLRSETIPEAVAHAHDYFARLDARDGGIEGAFDGYDKPGVEKRARITPAA